MAIRIRHHGDFRNTERFFRRALRSDYFGGLAPYGERGVAALSMATPADTGQTARQWSYEIVREEGVVKIVFFNDNVSDGVNIAIILQYGHGTRNGGYVSGRDYINPALRPIFDEIAENAWKEVTSS